MRLIVFIVVDGAIGSTSSAATTTGCGHCVQNEAYYAADYQYLNNQFEDNNNQTPYGYDATEYIDNSEERKQEAQLLTLHKLDVALQREKDTNTQCQKERNEY